MSAKRRFKTDRDGRVCCSLKLFWKTIERARKTWGLLQNDKNKKNEYHKTKDIQDLCKKHTKLVRQQNTLIITGKDHHLYVTYCMINKLTKIRRDVS